MTPMRVLHFVFCARRRREDFGYAGCPKRAAVCYTSANAFDIIGEQPLIGRVLTEAEDKPAAEQVNSQYARRRAPIDALLPISY